MYHSKDRKYKPSTKTIEKLHIVQESRANEMVRTCASLPYTVKVLEQAAPCHRKQA